MKKIAAFMLLFALSNIPVNKSTPAYAQSGRYNGPPMDFERVRQEPSLYDECKHLYDDSSREASACHFGVEEGRRMAMKYGGGYGRIQGFLRGFSWGLHRMADLTSYDSRAMRQGARAVDGMDSYIDAAIQLGKKEGESQGRAAGTKMAVERFTSAVDTGRFPSSQFTLPPVLYRGEDNGYERFVDSNGPKSPQQILQGELSSLNSHLNAYENPDRAFIGDIPHISLRDAWKDDGLHRFDRKQWLDGDSALKIWIEKPVDGKPRYNALNDSKRKEFTSEREGRPAEGKPEAKAARATDLQQIFRSSFVKAYAHYAHYYFSQEFYNTLDDGQMQGEFVGIELGKRIAYQKGLIEAFNAKAKETSMHAFQSAFEDTCRDSFRNTFYDYSDNAKLTIDFSDVIGMTEDGIIQPGETIAVSFKVTNSGGQAASLRASMEGDVVEPHSVTLGGMPALATKVFTTPAIAAISPQLRTGMNANLLLKVNGIDVPHAEKVLTPIQITSYKNAFETTAGKVLTNIAVQNISTRRSTGNVKVQLIFSGKTHAKDLGMVEAGQFKETDIAISGVDPFELIKGIDTGIEITMNDRLMSDSQFKLIPPDTKLELASYFDQLIKGRGWVPENLPVEDRITSVKKLIVDKNLADVTADTDGNPWKDNKLSTMLGLLVHNLTSLDQTSATKKIYSKLGKDLWEHRKKLGQVLFIKSGKRKEYESLCKELM
jgi:flagellar biosynthesis/type III secretory pathway protein FliH